MDDKEKCIICKRVLAKPGKIKVCHYCKHWMQKTGLGLSAVLAITYKNRENLTDFFDRFYDDSMKMINEITQKWS